MLNSLILQLGAEESTRSPTHVEIAISNVSSAKLWASPRRTSYSSSLLHFVNTQQPAVRRRSEATTRAESYSSGDYQGSSSR